MKISKGNMSSEILNYGGAVRTLIVPDRDGNPVDVVLGFDRIRDYEEHGDHFGAIIGRFGNRIGGASFSLNGKTYELTANDGRNHLHGGPGGFDRLEWETVSLTEDSVTLKLVSPDGQENYPGNLTVKVTYTLTEDSLIIDYHAVSDADTLCNLTNHSYFNLNGHDGGTIRDHYVKLYADHYTDADAELIPTGVIASVEGTPLDLRELTRIGDGIDDPFEMMQNAGGYDFNFVINDYDGTMKKAAEVCSEKTGIRVEVFTDLPGIQFYTGNFLGNTPVGKGGAVYQKQDAFCLETQVFPDAPHHENFPTAVLKAGEEYKTRTIYRFSVI